MKICQDVKYVINGTLPIFRMVFIPKDFFYDNHFPKSIFPNSFFPELLTVQMRLKILCCCYSYILFCIAIVDYY